MKILVTGGSGFIGTRLVSELLKQNHKVVIFDKSPSAVYSKLVVLGDVRDRKKLIDVSKNIDVIYHLAAEHADDVTPVSLYREVNIGGAENVVAAAEINNINRVIFTSTVAIYGLDNVSPDETTVAQPFNEYSVTKHEAEKLFYSWAKSNVEKSLVVLRPAVVFGEQNRGNVYNLINQIKTGRFTMVGAGTNFKSMGYVGNIVVFLALQTKSIPGIHKYNFADKPDLSAIEIVNIIREELGITKKLVVLPYRLALFGGYTFDFISKMTGKKFLISSIRIKKFTAETTIDTTRLLESGFSAPYSLKDGLKKMIENEFL